MGKQGKICWLVENLHLPWRIHSRKERQKGFAASFFFFFFFFSFFWMLELCPALRIFYVERSRKSSTLGRLREITSLNRQLASLNTTLFIYLMFMMGWFWVVSQCSSAINPRSIFWNIFITSKPTTFNWTYFKI